MGTVVNSGYKGGREMSQTEGLWQWWTANLTFVGTRPEFGKHWERSALATLNGHRTQAEANARRIVACVNACADIPTESLESAAEHLTLWRRLDSLSEEAAFYANKEDQT